MLKIYRIALLEVGTLFYSPVAWLVLAVFVVQNGLGFFGILFGVREALSMGIDVGNITTSAFPGMNGLFDSVLKNIYLYMPLLTMGLMSRETSSGSIKLLLSSPVKITQIVLGKYLAIVIYGLCLMAVLLSYSIVGVLVIRDADIGLITSGLCGVFLVICTYGAIGLFMSSLTSYPVVAAVSTLAVFAGLKFIGNIGSEVPLLRDLTWFLSISGRAEDIVKGLITSKDILYFLLIITFFCWLCIYRLRSERRSTSFIERTVCYMAAVVLTLLAGYISSRPRWILYKDMTATKSLTLAPVSQRIARQFKGALKITTYVNLLDANVYNGLPANRNADLALFDRYRRFIPDLEMDYIYYYDKTDLEHNSNMIYQGDISHLSTRQVAEKVADNMNVEMSMFLSPDSIRKQVDLEPEGNQFVRILQYRGRTSRLRMYNDMNRLPDETEISAALKQLLVPTPLIAFSTGNNERSIDRGGDRNYTLMANSRHTRHSLINQGFGIATLDLERDTLPDDLTVLVVGDPDSLGSNAMAKLKAYVDRGGNLLVTVEPGRQTVLTPFLRSLGITIREGMLIQPGKDYSADRIPGQIAAGAGTLGRAFAGLAGRGVVLRSAVGLQNEGNPQYHVDTLLLGHALSAGQTSGRDGAGRNSFFPVMLTLQRDIGGHHQKICISGDADVISNQAWAAQEGSNQSFTTGLFSWFCDGIFPVKIRRPVPQDNDLLAGQRRLRAIKTGLLFGVTTLLVAAGMLLLMIRRRR